MGGWVVGGIYETIPLMDMRSAVSVHSAFGRLSERE